MGIHNKAVGMISRYSSVFAFFSTVAAFGGGAPNFGQVCNDMKPGHGIPPQSSGFPLTVANAGELETLNYQSEDFVKFELDGVFGGILLQVRDENGATVGEFCHSTMPVDLQYVNCAAHGRGERSTLTHKVGGFQKLEPRCTGNRTARASERLHC